MKLSHDLWSRCCCPRWRYCTSTFLSVSLHFAVLSQISRVSMRLQGADLLKQSFLRVLTDLSFAWVEYRSAENDAHGSSKAKTCNPQPLILLIDHNDLFPSQSV